MSDASSRVITIPALPTAADDELVRRFTVTHYYLRHLEIFLGHTYGSGRHLYPGIGSALSQHRPFLKLQRRTSPIDLDSLQRHLEIGWVGEVELRLPAAIGQGVAFRYTNAWAPIHAYYATYMLLQAWFDANGMTGLADDHTATLRSISTQIQQRDLFPVPWSVLASGNPLGGTCVYINEPMGDACVAKVEVLSIPIGLPGAYSEAEFWARFGTWLRTTREARLKVKEDEWKRKHGRKRIDPQVRARFATSLHATSIFDCLWRLRIRSNYRSVETYLARFVGDDDAESFHRALATVTKANLFLLECYVARVVGASVYKTMVKDFLDRDPQGVAAKTVGARFDPVIAAATTPGAGRA